MNFQQIGYTQALWDLGFQKEAGLFDSARKGISGLFRSRAPAAAPGVARAAAPPSGIIGSPGFRYSRMPSNAGQAADMPIPDWLSNFKPMPASQWGGRVAPKAPVPAAPTAKVQEATLPGISRDQIHNYFSRQARADSNSLRKSLQRGTLEGDLSMDELRSFTDNILADVA